MASVKVQLPQSQARDSDLIQELREALHDMTEARLAFRHSIARVKEIQAEIETGATIYPLVDKIHEIQAKATAANGVSSLADAGRA